MSRIRLAGFALTAAMLAATGCGGSTKSSSKAQPAARSEPPIATAPTTGAPANPLTRLQLIAKADAICRRVNARRGSITIRSEQDYARLIPPLASYEQVAFAELNKLAPPASMASAWKQIVADAHTVATDTARIGEYAVAGSLRATQPLLMSATSTLERMRATASHNHFKDCAQAP